MEKKNIDWAKLGFGYTKTDYRWQSEGRRLGSGRTDYR